MKYLRRKLIQLVYSRRHGRASVALALATFIGFCTVKLVFHSGSSGDTAAAVGGGGGGGGFEFWLPLPRYGPVNLLSAADDYNNGGAAGGGADGGVLGGDVCRRSSEAELGRIPRVRRRARADIDAGEVFRRFNFTEKREGNASSWFYNDPFFERRYWEDEEKLVRDRPPLKVILMMWSHLDPGWLRSYDEYQTDVNKIYSGFVKRVEAYPNISFTTAEISFFSRFYESCDDTQKAYIRKIVDQKRLEFVSGGWVMTDEAAASLYAMVDQFIEGHNWLSDNLGFRPKSGWSVDPFGHGSTVPYLLAASGVGQTVIQRIHYAWKDYFARNQIQDFKWRQWWDGEGKADCLTHHMPYNIYSIESSCGPFADVCEYFDFRSVGQITPYAMKHTPITASTVKNQSKLLLAMYRRTASLLTHNVLLQPLGDDFRYDFNVEFDQQYRNYDALAKYFNANPQFKVEMSFGTLSDYFDAVKERTQDFKTLEGDFFPYAHSPDNYWTGYFSSRPFWKVTARELEAELRAAEILLTWAFAEAKANAGKSGEGGARPRPMDVLAQSYQRLSDARRTLGLFQHHDAITGTSQARVMADYGRRLHKAMSDARKSQAATASFLVTRGLPSSPPSPSSDGGPKNKEEDRGQSFVTVKLVPLSWNRPSPIRCLNLTASPEIVVALFNPLAQRRTTVTKLCLTAEKFTLTNDADGTPVQLQINPLSAGMNANHYVVSTTWFEVEFAAEVGPLEIRFFRLKKAAEGAQAGEPVQPQDFVKIRSHYKLKTVAKAEPLFRTSDEIPTSSESTSAMPGVPFSGAQLPENGSFSIGNAVWELEFDFKTGLPTRVRAKDAAKEWRPLRVELLAYEPVPMKSGAYTMKFFKPVPEEILQPFRARSIVTEGRLESSVRTIFGEFANVTITLHEAPDLAHAINVQITLDMWRHPETARLTHPMSKEVFLRVRTDLKSAGQDFYTDSSGFTITKRTAIPSLDTAANYYPATTSFHIQAGRRRAMLLLGQSHGVTAATAPGVMDVMLDRTAQFDDGKGMREGVEDSKRTNFRFAFLLEESPTADVDDDDGARLLSPVATTVARQLNNPPVGFLSATKAVLYRTPWEPAAAMRAPLPCNVHLLNFRLKWKPRPVNEEDGGDDALNGISPATFTSSSDDETAAIILHHEGVNVDFGCVPPRCGFTKRKADEGFALKWNFPFSSATETTLTGLHEKGGFVSISNDGLILHCDPMQLCSYKIKF